MSKNIENSTDKEKVADFNKRYGYHNKSNRDSLDKIAYNNKNLIKKFILGKAKNPFYTPYNTSPIKEQDNEYYALIQWIIPKERLDYKIVGWQEYCSGKNVIRSSFIPVVKINGVNHWLLGSFHDYEKTNNPILSDFGGTCEAKDKKTNCTAFNCALRELNEESEGGLSKIVDESIINGNMVIYQATLRNNYKIYFTFVELDYDSVKDFLEYFKTIKNVKTIGEEKFGKIELYNQKDIKGGKYRTSKNLTDFLDFLQYQ